MVAQAQRIQVKRIRGPNLAVLAKSKPGVPAEEGLRLANKGNLVVVSNKRWDRALVGSDEWKQPNVRPAWPAWSGTMAGYKEPGKPLGATIELVDRHGFKYVFPVPQEYQRKRNVALVSEHPDYEIVAEGKNRVIVATKVDLVRNFPAATGWYLTDPDHGIPTGAIINSSDARDLWRTARYLWRTDTMVTLVIRGGHNFCAEMSELGWGIGLENTPSVHLGVAVEAAAGLVERLG